MAQFIRVYIDCNDIGSSGAKLLIKTVIPQLRRIRLSKYNIIKYVDKCNMGCEAMHHLSKVDWPNLEIIDISNNSILYS